MQRSMLLWIAFVYLLCLTIFGIWSGKLLQQEIWQGTGLDRFLLLAGVTTLWFGALDPDSPRHGQRPPRSHWSRLIQPSLSGALPLLAACFILLSCFVLGSVLWTRAENAPSLTADLLRTLLGLIVFMWLTGLLVHFPVNYPATYVVLLLIPFGTSSSAHAGVPATRAGDLSSHDPGSSAANTRCSQSRPFRCSHIGW